MGNVTQRINDAATQAQKIVRDRKRGTVAVFHGTPGDYAEDDRNKASFIAAVKKVVPPGTQVSWKPQPAGNVGRTSISKYKGALFVRLP